MEGLTRWARELELSDLGNGKPLEDCEQRRDTVTVASCVEARLGEWAGEGEVRQGG